MMMAAEGDHVVTREMFALTLAMWHFLVARKWGPVGCCNLFWEYFVLWRVVGVAASGSRPRTPR